MAQAHKRSLAQWIEYIQTIHFREIELGLERVSEVYRRLIPQGLNCTIISVAGTNGKGSTAELLSSIYTAAGYAVGKFTSPHLIDYAERFSINGQSPTDHQLIAAFERIEQARDEIPLTFFEFGTLMAIELFHAAPVDVAVMEVGLGGRLDAVNILDADVSIITSISIDHSAWLGSTVDEIAREKMGIARAKQPCLIGLPNLSQDMRANAKQIGMDLQQMQKSFDYLLSSGSEIVKSWDYLSCVNNRFQTRFSKLPLPFGQTGVQLSNACLALRAVELLMPKHPLTPQHVNDGIARAQLLARCQVVATKPTIVLDVAHNEASVARLAEFIRGLKPRRCAAVCGMLKDKEIAKSLSCLTDQVDEWHFVTINNERGETALALKASLDEQASTKTVTSVCYDDVRQAYSTVEQTLTEHDVLVVFGSFFIAGDILALLRERKTDVVTGETKSD